jgi:dTDP-4-amino-4,6-dideoxygalactose transaminase
MTADSAIPRQTVLRPKYLRPGGSPGPSLCVSRQTLNLFWARNGIYLGLRELGIVPGTIVLVPSFVCRSVPEAVAASGAAVEFYRVDSSGRADLEDLQERIRPGIRGVLAIHYFSGLQPHIADVRELCDRHGLWLLEDSAHLLPEVLQPGGAGAFGDVCVFSWRKFLPVYDGGGLLLRAGSGKTTRPALSRQAGVELRAAKDVIDRWRSAGRSRAGRFGPQQDAGHDLARRLAGAAHDPNSDAFDAQLVTLPMSRVSEWILRHSDLAGIVSTRRRNWLQLHERVRTLRDVEPWSGELTAGHGPWAYALTFPGVTDAHKALRRLGVPAANWEGVQPALLPRQLFPEAENLYRELVFLPMHQDLNVHDIQAVAEAIRRTAARERGPSRY